MKLLSGMIGGEMSPRASVHVKMYISGSLCAWVGSKTFPFITPHGQLSAEGKMEVVSWGLAGRFSYH